MEHDFLDPPVLNSPCGCPQRRWELDAQGQPTQKIIPARRRAEFAVLDPYNPVGYTAQVNFITSSTDRWETDARRCHINWVILDSDWEAEFCRVAEAHPHVLAYAKNHHLGLDVRYRMGAEPRIYRPDFLVLIDDGRSENV